MIKRCIIFLGLLTLLTVSAQVSKATYITMKTETKINMEDDTAKILVGITNKGDEPAYNVRISAEIDGKIEAGPLEDRLEVNEKHSLELSTDVKFKKPGKYPVIIIVDYTDQNQYPFTAISIAYLNHKEKVIGRAIGEVGVTPVVESGTVKVKIKNLEQVEKKIDVRLVLPKELSSHTPREEVTVKPGTEETVVFNIKNISALPGSHYQIYAILGYEDDQYHYSNAVSGSIEVKEKETIVATYRKLLIAAAIILVVMVVYLNVRRKVRSKV